ncbi:unnamed protein product, partial [marine sediment metagenome]
PIRHLYVDPIAQRIGVRCDYCGNLLVADKHGRCECCGGPSAN